MKKGFLTGLLLFGIFFGAGNLIFPPNLGKLSGENFNLTIFGFILSGVGLAILTLVVGTLDKDGFKLQMSKKISPAFSVGFLIILYLAIGPFFAIPRTASASFSMGVAPFTGSGFLPLLIYTFLYFGTAYLFSLFPSNIVSSIGKFLTPVFIVLIMLLVLLGAIKYRDVGISPASAAYSSAKAFSTGFIEGYSTLDALASIAFSVIAVNTLKKFTFSSRTEYKNSVYIAGITAAVLFSILYYGLAYLGNRFPVPDAILNDTDINNGVYIISNSAKEIFGNYGGIFLGVMVIVTCFTTTVGLIVSVSEFFYELYPKIGYKTYMTIFNLISFAITYLGLTTVIKISLPVLSILYPMVIAILLIILLSYVRKLSNPCLQLTVGITFVISFCDVIIKTFNLKFLENIFSHLPFYEQSLSWLIPALILLTLSVFLPAKAE